ncbi:MAG TPA: fumarylacetoacetate hydrolase family protein [Burkholderiales bacterium]|nr:fumarylacetoacetate hydrolase family protein [Burkholderiales bacterium]
MKLVTFTMGNAPPRAGALIEGGRRVLDLQAAYGRVYHGASPLLASVLAMIEAGEEALEVAGQLLETAVTAGVALGREEVRLLAPVPQPPQMRDFLCFEKHLVQAFRAIGSEPPRAWYERPIFYHPSRFSVCGPEAEVPWPAYCEKLDFELEFGCYIGRPGKDIPKERARSHIFGYTIFNDFSARDEQAKEMAGSLGPGKGKDFDNANAMGPCLVTADEIGDPYRLEMAVRVNGEEWGRGNSRDMHWKFEDCIAHAARSETLHAGEFFGSGTVGNGCGLEQMRFLEPGDVVELEVEGIGVLRNRVVR